ncbi:MAG: 2,3-dihydro-2,3-dihydroxybenzoate dehydrogenase [Candidatus Hinthialibacteria bacterium OLB16]|nr:MAG: 2,3-dihydro-2,3-dihydroxybenzoate dehydrogenase [Candidatus Hinthialibacteria bacterium OLB16]
MELKNRGVLITGAGRGLGKVLALSLAYCGCRLGLVSRTEKELNEVARSIQGKKGSAVVLPADITNSAAVQKMVARAEGELGTSMS